jgi:hypothetical protein
MLGVFVLYASLCPHQRFRTNVIGPSIALPWDPVTYVHEKLVWVSIDGHTLVLRNFLEFLDRPDWLLTNFEVRSLLTVVMFVSRN